MPQVENRVQYCSPILGKPRSLLTSSARHQPDERVQSKCCLLEFHWPLVSFAYGAAQCGCLGRQVSCQIFFLFILSESYYTYDFEVL